MGNKKSNMEWRKEALKFGERVKTLRMSPEQLSWYRQDRDSWELAESLSLKELDRGGISKEREDYILSQTEYFRDLINEMKIFYKTDKRRYNTSKKELSRSLSSSAAREVEVSIKARLNG